ncbi:MAG: hypothetical protein QM755_06665 [Luteolibacter sp.]
MRGYRSQSGSGYSGGDDDQESLVKTLGSEDLNELLKIIDPGDSKSLVKRLEYASLCEDFGKNDLALTMLEKLHAERPSIRWLPDVICS